MERYIGLMSGTSADGIDAVVAEFSEGRFQRLAATHHCPHPADLRAALIALGRDSEAQISLSALAGLDVALARQFAAAALAVVQASGLAAQDIRAIGSHGQTIFHEPKRLGSSMQLGDPNHIAALTSLPVVADFRRMDVALGGEGAPLVPAFHAAVFSGDQPGAVVNIGGIANVTWLPGSAQGDVKGHDCGPGNALMDEWTMRQLGRAFDQGGRFAAQGQVLPTLLSAWLSEPYFALAAPKSTGRSLFNLEWADALAEGGLAGYAPADVQATLCELTAKTICEAIPGNTDRVLVCGGGVFNAHLMRRIEVLKPSARVASTETAGLAPQWVEAAAFAWLAHQRIHQLPGNLPSVTGASHPAVLGGLYG